MLGVAIGILCGALELFLLTRITGIITGKSEKPPLPYILLKILILGASLAFVAVVDAKQLAVAGIAVAAVLIGGGAVIFFMETRGR